MIEKLKKRLDRYKKQMEKLDKEFQDGKIPFETYFGDRFELDKRIASVFELDKKRIHNEEFSDSQLDLWINMAADKAS